MIAVYGENLPKYVTAMCAPNAELKKVKAVLTSKKVISLYRPWRPLGLCQPYAPATLYFPPGRFLVHFCWRLSRLQGHSEAGRIIQIEKIHLIRDWNW
jgi:hypothetical protein